MSRVPAPLFLKLQVKLSKWFSVSPPLLPRGGRGRRQSTRTALSKKILTTGLETNLLALYTLKVGNESRIFKLLGCLGGSVWSILLQLRSWSQDPCMSSSPASGSCADSLQPGACFGFCDSLSLCLSPACSLSLSLSQKINKKHLKKFLKRVFKLVISLFTM